LAVVRGWGKASMAWVIGIGIFLFLLFAFPKQIGFIILCIVGVCIFYYVKAEHDSKRKSELISMIKHRAAADSKLCSDPNYPISVGFLNDTNKTINRISFILSSKREGFSSNISTSYLDSDKILKPNEGYVNCWSLSSYDLQYGKLKDYKISDLKWNVEILSADFQQ
jgi:uncharacterized membrane protein